MNALAKTEPQQLAQYTNEQRELIKRTCAPGATDDELAMYLHVAAQSGLDPLRRQLHFIKVSGRLCFVADVNGLQARAAQESDFEGIAHAVVYEKDSLVVDEAKQEIAEHKHNPFGNNGRIVGAWAIVRRRGMLPFLSLVRFSEYDNGNNPLWKSKPGVMIDKVAKSTALRIAYPTQLGSIYDRSELDKSMAPEPSTPPPTPAPPTAPVARLERATEDAATEVPGEPPASVALPAGPPQPKTEAFDRHFEAELLSAKTIKELRAIGAKGNGKVLNKDALNMVFLRRQGELNRGAH